MKTQSSLIWLLALAVSPVLAGEAPANLGTTAPTVSTVTGTPTAATESAVPQGTGKVRLSSWSAEVAKLAEAGLDDYVIQAFIDAAGTFNLDSDQIIYLRDVGASSETISAMLRHDVELGTGMRQMSASAVPPSPPRLELKLVPKLTLELSPEKTVGSGVNGSASAESDTIATQVPEREGPGIAVPVRTGPDFFLPVIAAEPMDTTERGVSPVRQPYAVELTDPILVFRGSGRTPNLVLLNPFP